MIMGRLRLVSSAVSIRIPSDTGGFGETISGSFGGAGVNGWRSISAEAISFGADGGSAGGASAFAEAVGRGAWSEAELVVEAAPRPIAVPDAEPVDEVLAGGA